MRGLSLIVCGLIAAFALAWSAAAQERIALVVGVGDYERDRQDLEEAGFLVPRALANATRDAALIGDALEASGFEVRRLTDPDKRALLAALGALADDLRAAGDDGVGVFYFAGHGAQGRPPFERDVDNYLLPVGAELQTETDLDAEALGLSRVSAQLSSSGAGAIVIILDACRNFALPQSDRAAINPRGLAEARALPGTLIAYATAPGDVASDGPAGGNGPYAAALARQLVEARGARLEDVFYAVRQEVLNATNRDQQPWENSSLVRPVTFGLADPAAPDPVIAAPVVAAPVVAPAGRTEAEIVAEAQELLTAMGYDPGPADGAAGTKTGDAVAAFRGATGLGEGREIDEDLAATLRFFRAQGHRAPVVVDAVAAVAAADAERRRAEQEYADLQAERLAALQEAGFAAPTVTDTPAGGAGEYAPGETFRDCDLCPEMVVVPAGSFTMGSPEGEAGRNDDEGPQHRVTIPTTFAAGRFEVTRGEYAAFVTAIGRADGGNCNTDRDRDGGWEQDTSASWSDPGFSQSDDHPVVCVSWDDAKAYVAWLSREAGESYRLLTEAEWEYVARAGTTTAYSFGEDSARLCSYGNGADQTAKRTYPAWRAADCDDGNLNTAPVGSFAENAFGLADMHGNVWEWVEDCYHDSYSGAPTDGSAVTGDCSLRVRRGGSWNVSPQNLRSSVRFRYVSEYRSNDRGFRVARTVLEP